MKKILFFIASVLLIVSCGMVDDIYYAPETGDMEVPEVPEVPIEEPDYPERSYWYNAADSISRRFINSFWASSNRYFRFLFTPTSSSLGGNGIPSGGSHSAISGTLTGNFQYWPQAHGMDVVIDAFVRTGGTPENKTTNAYYAYYDSWFAGVRAGNGNGWNNSYVDDVEWNVLTMLRMYETTGEETYLTTAKSTYDNYIWRYWTETWPSCGGILWNTNQFSKNACSNGPGGVCAAKLAYYLSLPEDKEKYLDQAKKIYDWLRAVLIYDYGVADNISGGGAITYVVLTYNQGTALGTAHWLYKLTGDTYYLDEAIKLAEKVTISGACSTWVDDGWVLRSEGAANADNGLFKGIFIRYFVPLINDPDVPIAKRKQFYNFMVHNATTLWTKGVHKTGNYHSYANASWWEQVAPSGQVAMQGIVSGATMMEGMYAVEPLE